MYKRQVHWSPSSRTALAEAELEYPEEHYSKSIYVSLKITKLSDDILLKFCKENPNIKKDFFLMNSFITIWTTTPWTIPANEASFAGMVQGVVVQIVIKEFIRKKSFLIFGFSLQNFKRISSDSLVIFNET